MKQRCLVIALFLLVLVTPLNVEASSEQSVYTEGYFEYIIENNAIGICGYFGDETEITLPAMIAGYPVSTIKTGAFDDCENIKTINLPDTIMEIESEAFHNNQTVIYNSSVQKPEDPKVDNNSSEGDKTEQSTESSDDEQKLNSSEKKEEGTSEETVPKTEENAGENLGTKEPVKESTESEKIEIVEEVDSSEPGLDEAEGAIDEEEFVQTEKENNKSAGRAITIVIAVIVIAALTVGGILLFKKKR